MNDTTVTRHGYVSQLAWLGDGDTGYSGSCICGWTSAYTHAYDKYAREDYLFHLKNEGIYK